MSRLSRSCIFCLMLVFAAIYAHADWVLSTNSAPWGAKRGLGVVVLEDRIWVTGTGFGGSRTWASMDGIQWEDFGGTGVPEVPTVVFENRIYRLYGDEINFAEFDGQSLQWSSACEYCPSSSFRHHAAAAFNGKLWQLGGFQEEDDDDEFSYEKFFAEVYSFTDASGTPEWTLVTDDAPWGGRASVAVVVFDGKLWLLGGRQGRPFTREEMNDVWYTEDGAHWVLATPNAAWCPRSAHAAVVYRDRIWILGGYGKRGSLLNDVWSSADGVNWRLETANAPWPVRARHAAAVFQDQIYVMGGDQDRNFTDHSDRWKSDKRSSEFGLLA